MRRTAVWMLGTVTVLVLLFSYHTWTSSRFAPSRVAVAGRDATDDAPDLPESGTFDGDPVVTRLGAVQVRITVAGGRIALAEALRVPNRDRHDVLVNERALPILNAEAVEAQSAQVELVSGATLTWQGYTQSLQPAIDRAGA
ncbi:MAG TPA: FMN-binding protein [Lapillicoccus sp.]|uniref:FMN-binding protein n=1 Tax=Lapillicoccus sp. TaxID=1909287 RepID=UPI002F950816